MYWKGQVRSIYVRSKPSEPVDELDEVLAVPGKGLKGDYYFAGSSSNKPGPGREITLIEQEALKAVENDNNVMLNPGDSRRNIITENVPLNHLVGREFRVGEVTLKGIRLCEPCVHLAELTQKEILPALVHRGGLRAQIITEGMIRAGDPVYTINHDQTEEAPHADFDKGS
jgi:MOSC domain-containing protein YiiM